MSKLANFYSSSATSNHADALTRRWYHSLLAHDDRYRYVAAWLNRLLQGGGYKVLDVACGVGLYEQAMDLDIRNKNTFVGVDISKHQLEHTKSVFNEILIANIEDEPLPFENASFDVIILSEIIEHLVEPEHVISECYRILKPRGRLIVTTPNLSSLQNRLSFLFFGTSREIDYKYNYQHIRFFSPASIKMLFGNFSLLHKRAIGSLFFYPNHFPIFIPVPRVLQIVSNFLLPNLGLSFFRVYEK